MSTDQHSIDVGSVLRGRAARVERALCASLDRLKGAPAKLIESMRYSLMAGGKRLRPALVLEWHAALIGSHEPNESAVAAAVAMELIHTFSLVHDDLPAMDDDDLRRGSPTNHKVFGEAMAILAGDAMTTLAFETIATDSAPQHAAKMAAELARASGPLGMVGGQVLDIENENVALPLDALRGLHAMKTGALLTAACRLGAIAADADAATLDRATRYGRAPRARVSDHGRCARCDGHRTADGQGDGQGRRRREEHVSQAARAGRKPGDGAAELESALEAIAPIPCSATLAALARFVVERAS